MPAASSARNYAQPPKKGLQLTLRERINILRSHGLPPQAVAAVLNISQADVRSLELDPTASVTDPFDAVGGGEGGGVSGAVDSVWGAGGAFYETMRRLDATGWGSPPSGILHLTGGITLTPDQPVQTVTLLSRTAFVNPTHQWCCLVRAADRSVLAKSDDLEDTPWPADAEQAFSFPDPVQGDPVFNVPVYVGVVAVYDSGGAIMGLALQDALTTLNPPIAALSDTGLTDPASLGATADPLGGDPDFLTWARLS